MTLEEMVTVMNESARRLRDEFQTKHPHYTPPPWARISVWDDWVRANEVLHGIDGFRERFPRHAAALRESVTSEGLLAGLRLAAL